MSVAIGATRGWATGIARSVRSGDTGWFVPRRRWRRLVAVILTAALGLAAVAVLVVRAVFGLPAGAALEVNGTVVSTQELQHRVSVLTALYSVQPPQGGQALDTFDRLAAKSQALTLVIDDAAKAQGITVADKDASAALDQLIQQGFPQGRQAFLNALSAKGASEQDVLNEVKLQLETSRLYDKTTAGVPAATDQDVQQAIASRAATAFSPEKRHIRNIVVSTQEQAQQILQQARSGQDFTALAQQFSEDGSTKSNGGDLGSVAVTQLDAGYGKQAFATAAGGVFGPVQDAYGWNVGQIVDVTQPAQLPDAQIKTNVTNAHKNDAWNAWLTGQLRNAKIRYADQYQPADPNVLTGTTVP
ncbi:hypothetical protein HFP15_10035 [Amycolatopsis sp. K13G38]|uniref:PpiC domain-containing protein n=1 Tax=Amycolatopsis acididurans TaxID=2724524 RepID=A0ABX1J4K4_9PSEU|nr:peptidylprolyl isomerase [Amycolatopsis acididurans]NKQ53221.1 hypothetical protein [Amycolatopsis acididurans]